MWTNADLTKKGLRRGTIFELRYDSGTNADLTKKGLRQLVTAIFSPRNGTNADLSMDRGKIDRSFTIWLLQGRREEAIVGGVVPTARLQVLDLVAEG